MDRLNNEPEVRSTKLHHAKIVVNFRDNIRENWVFDRVEHTNLNYLLPDDPFEGGPVPIRHEYLFNSLDDNAEQMTKLFRIDHRQWRAASFWNQRIAIHKLANRILDEGWREIDFHHRDLTEDLKYLNGVSLKKRHFWDGQLHIFGRYSKYYPGKMLVEQFTDWGAHNFKDAWTDPMQVFLTIRNLLRHRRDVTRHSMLCEMNHNARKVGPTFICPNVYRTMFKLLGLDGYVMADPDPGFGSKAIAATLAGCEYHSRVDFTALADFLGTEFHEMDREQYDCVLLDYHWSDPGEKVYEDVAEWENKADVVIVFVPRQCAKKMPKPDKYIRITTSPIRGADHDFVFYYV